MSEFFWGEIKIEIRAYSHRMAVIQFLKNKFRKSRQKRWNRLYDRSHISRVEKGLKVLASQGKVLSTENSKKAEEYAITVLGSVDFAPWLKLYTAFRGEFLEGWIPDNYLGRVVCPAINGRYRGIGQLKTLSRRILQSEALPDLAYCIKGNWITVAGETLEFSKIKTYLFDQHPIIFLKKDYSLQGNGVVKLDSAKFSEFDFKSAGDFVIQAPIQQHSFFEEISPGSVATLRITTVKPAGQPATNRLTTLRVGRLGMEYIYTSDCIRVPVFPENGNFYSHAISPDWTVLDVHPDTQVAFEGRTIPEFAKAVRLCEQLHDRFAHFEMIGWDVSIEQNGEAKIMEWNTDEPGIVFSEAAIGPHFRGLGWEKR